MIVQTDNLFFLHFDSTVETLVITLGMRWGVSSVQVFFFKIISWVA